ncbi:MAG TPA: hypothetical protein VGK29_28295 [Paludibaculum sp.]
MTATAAGGDGGRRRVVTVTATATGGDGDGWWVVTVAAGRDWWGWLIW